MNLFSIGICYADNVNKINMYGILEIYNGKRSEKCQSYFKLKRFDQFILGGYISPLQPVIFLSLKTTIRLVLFWA